MNSSNYINNLRRTIEKLKAKLKNKDAELLEAYREVVRLNQLAEMMAEDIDLNYYTTNKTKEAQDYISKNKES